MVPMLLMVKLAVDLSLSKVYGLMKQLRPFAFGKC